MIIIMVKWQTGSGFMVEMEHPDALEQLEDTIPDYTQALRF